MIREVTDPGLIHGPLDLYDWLMIAFLVVAIIAFFVVVLWVLASNERGRRFWTRAGFLPDDRVGPGSCVQGHGTKVRLRLPVGRTGEPTLPPAC